MTPIATIGAIIRVSPATDINVSMPDVPPIFLEDRTPFEFRVEDRLYDGQLFYGLYGPVVSGPEQYRDLICSITVRMDATDWRKTSCCHANFKVGKSKVERNHRYGLGHPDGTVTGSYPEYCTFAEIRVVE
ncbi:MAG: hypothetical protein Tsb009_30720 [Planctomycetaceae bacterium]